MALHVKIKYTFSAHEYLINIFGGGVVDGIPRYKYVCGIIIFGDDIYINAFAPCVCCVWVEFHNKELPPRLGDIYKSINSMG